MLVSISGQICREQIKHKDFFFFKECWQNNKFILSGKILVMQSSIICIVASHMKKD